MRTPIRFALAAALAVSLFTLVSCGKDEQEAQKFNRADDETFKRDMSDLTSFKLANGATVYLQEERTDNQVALCAVYHAGYTRDPKGKIQLAHLTEHMSMKCASGKYKAGETMSTFTDRKEMITAEAVADFIHIDYVVDAKNLDQTLAIEASRLNGIQCDEATLEQGKKEVVGEFPASLEMAKGNLTRVSIGGLTHVMCYGETHLQMEAGVGKLTIDDVRQFHDTYYRPDDMILVLIGNFKKADAEAMVRKHFEPIPSRPAPTDPSVSLKRSLRATWDVPAQVLYYVAPGPFGAKERLILTMFGQFVQQLFVSSPDVYQSSQAIYTSNPSYPVGRLPFFIFIQAKEGFTTNDAIPAVFSRLDQAIQALDDDRRIEAIKANTVSFVTSSSLQPDEPDYPMMHFQVIGQEALNVCLRHLSLDGRTPDQYTDEVMSITPEEFRTAVKKHLDRSKLLSVAIEPRS